jgi:MFS family permease
VASTASDTGTWRELLGNYLGIATVLAAGVALYSTNEFLTVSLLPNAMTEIGGRRLYAWATTLYLVGSVVAATAVNPMLARVGARTSYLMGLAVFGVASVVSAVAPSMEVLVAGRSLQGVAGGLLAGLGYALINSALPQWLWTRGSALVSTMWAVATLVGPVTGGIFAQFGLWRWAFVLMAVLTALMAMLVVKVLSRGENALSAPARDQAAAKVPIWSLLLIGSAALAVSIAELPRYRIQTVGLLAAGALLAGAFLLAELRMKVAVLPRGVFRPGPLKWIYLTMSAQMVAAMVTTYVPLFGQRLAHLTPMAAGFLSAALAVGWTVSEIVSATLTNQRVIGVLIATAPLVMASGLALGGLTQHRNASVATVAVWALALLIAGTGIGIAWPHLTVRAMNAVDPAESRAAAAAINIVQLVSAAFGAGLAGVVVNAAPGGPGQQARWLYAGFTILAAASVLASFRATRGDRSVR